MKRVTLKRITAFALAMIMTLSLLPMSVWAEGEQTEYTPLYWSFDGGQTYHNGIEEPFAQPLNNDGRMATLYVKDGDSYTAIDKQTFGNDTITKLSEDIGFFGWNDSRNMLFWNTESAIEGTESGVVFTVDGVKYLVKLNVIAVSLEQEAAEFIAKYAKNRETGEGLIDISKPDDISWLNVNAIYEGVFSWQKLNAEQKAAVNAQLNGVTFDDMLEVAIQRIYPTENEFVRDWLTKDGTQAFTTISAENLWRIEDATPHYLYLSDTVKSAVDTAVDTNFASIKEAGTTLTFNDLGAAASFIRNFVRNWNNETLITKLDNNSTGDEIRSISRGESTWGTLTAVQQAAVNKSLVNADATAQTYEQMLAYAKTQNGGNGGGNGDGGVSGDPYTIEVVPLSVDDVIEKLTHNDTFNFSKENPNLDSIEKIWAFYKGVDAGDGFHTICDALAGKYGTTNYGSATDPLTVEQGFNRVYHTGEFIAGHLSTIENPVYRWDAYVDALKNGHLGIALQIAQMKFAHDTMLSGGQKMLLKTYLETSMEDAYETVVTLIKNSNTGDVVSAYSHRFLWDYKEQELIVPDNVMLIRGYNTAYGGGADNPWNVIGGEEIYSTVLSDEQRAAVNALYENYDCTYPELLRLAQAYHIAHLDKNISAENALAIVKSTEIGDLLIKLINNALIYGRPVQLAISAVVAENMNADDKDALDNAVPEGYEVENYQDIDVSVTVNGQTTGVTQTDGKVTVKVGKAEKGKEYKMVRKHGDKVDVLPVQVDEEGNLIVESDQFSSYALVSTSDSANEPFSLNGIEIYTKKDDDHGNYHDWSTYDGLCLTKAGPPSGVQHDAVKVTYKPGQVKKLYLKATDASVTLSSNLGGGMSEKGHAELSAIEESTGIYELTLKDTATEYSNVRISLSNNAGLDIIFEPQTGGNGNGGDQNDYPPLFIYSKGQDGNYNYFNGTGFPVGGVQEFSLYIQVQNSTTSQWEYVPITAADGYILGCSDEILNGRITWSTAEDKENVAIVDTRGITVNAEKQVYLTATKYDTTNGLRLFLHPGGNQGSGPVELNGIQIFTSFAMGQFGYNDGDARPWVQRVPNGPTMAFIPMMPKSDYTPNVVKSVYLVSGEELTLLANNEAVFGNATLTLTDITLDNNRKVYRLQVPGQSAGTEGDVNLKIGNSDNVLLLHFRAQWNGQNMSCWKDYVTPSGNSTVTVRLSPEQAPLITLPESINENNELIITVHNAAENNDAVWEMLANRNQGFLLPFEYGSIEGDGVNKPQVKSIGTGYTIEKSLEMLEDESYSFSNYYQGGGGVRMNGLFFAWTMEDAGRTIIVPTEDSVTGAWIWRYEDATSVNGYTDKKEGVIVKIVLDEDISNAVTLEQNDEEYVAEGQIKELNYPSLKPFIDFARTNDALSYANGVLTYQYKGEKTNYNAVTAELRSLAEVHNDTGYPKITLKDEQGGNILAYPLLEIYAPTEGYRIKSVATDYNDNNYDGGTSVVLWYDWWGPGSEVTYTLTWVDADNSDGTNLPNRVQQITIKTSGLSSGETWMDHINDGENHATPVPVERLVLSALAEGCGAQHVYTPGYLLTEFDNSNTDLDVEEILNSTISVKAPDGAKGYRLVFSSDGNDDPSYNCNNAWSASSFQENVEAADLVVLSEGQTATKVGPLEDPLRKQELGDIEYYYSADRGTRLLLLKWIYDLEDEDNEENDAGQDPTYEYIQMDTTPYYCTLKSALGDVGDKEVVNKPMADVTEVPEGNIYLETRIHPQDKNYGQYFFELRLVDGAGNTIVEYDEDGYTIILPYSFMGEGWSYEMAENLKEKPVINHYDKNFNLKKNNGAITGKYTERGIEFVVNDFSPFMLTWTEETKSPTAPVMTTSDDLNITFGYKDQQVSVTVTAEEKHTYTYQWYDAEGRAISSATSAVYAIPENLPVGKYTYYCIVKATRDGSDEEVSATSDSVTVTVEKAVPVVTEPANLTATYGQTLADIVLPKVANGTWNWKDSSINVGCVGSHSFMAVFTPDDTENYVTVEVDVTVTVGKAPLTVTAKEHTVVYGAAPANNGVEYSGFVAGETASVLGGTLTYTYTYTQNGDVGNYAITPAGLSSDNYDIDFVNGTLTVEQKEIGIAWDATALAYNGSAQAPTATATGVVNSDVVTLTVDGAQTNVGSYTATVTAVSNSNYKLPTNVTTEFTIAKADQAAPAVGKIDETISKKADGAITGVDSTMEYSTDGNTYTTISGDKVENLAAAVYYVRVKGDENHNPSPATQVIVDAGRKLVVTYIADGVTVATVDVDYGANAVAPAVPEKVGYTQTAPTWDKDGKNITTDTEITAMYTINKYTVTYNVNGGTGAIAEQTKEHGVAISLSATEPTRSGYMFTGWNTAADGSGTAYAKSGTYEGNEAITLYAQWRKSTYVGPTIVPPTAPEEKPTETKPTTPVTPVQPATPSAEVTIPVSGEENTIHVEASVNGNTASIDKVDMSHLNEVIGDHVETGTVTIDFSDLESDETIDTVELPAEVVKEIAEAVASAENDAESLEIVLSDGASIEFDAAALSEKVAQAGGADITISIKHVVETILSAAQQQTVGERVAFDINVTSGGVHISDMGGKIVIHAPYELRDGESADGIVVYYVDDAGNREKCKTSYDSAKKRVNWETNHLSVYMIDYEAPAVDEPVVDEAPAIDTEPANSAGLWIGVSIVALAAIVAVLAVMVARKKRK